ncbi:hypothetical protein MPSEU_000120000 [Mayamaea pseudoterrestris]|nr:hypothetical protein MPSEU_000120000 [Mayamaea pseudoterrestris]
MNVKRVVMWCAASRLSLGFTWLTSSSANWLQTKYSIVLGSTSHIHHERKSLSSMPPAPPVIAWSDLVNNPIYASLPLLSLLPEIASLCDTLASLRNNIHRRPIVSIPIAQLRSRSFELPPRDVDFVILVQNDADRVTAMEFLVPTAKQQQKPWSVVGVVVLNEHNLECDNELATTRTAKKQRNEAALEITTSADDSSSLLPCYKQTQDSTSAFVPLDRLWQPDPMVSSILLPLLVDKLTQASYINNDSNTSSTKSICYEIWDVGSGAGRDVCFLAEQLKSQLPSNVKFRVVAMDQRYRSPQAEQPIHDFFERRNVSLETVVRKVDVDKEADSLLHSLDQNNNGTIVLCMYAVRYWNKAFVERLIQSMKESSKNAVDTRVEPFIFATSHFCKPHAGANWLFDHPKPHHVLERHELRNMFQAAPVSGNSKQRDEWKILRDDIVTDTDHGRTLLQFVVER